MQTFRFTLNGAVKEISGLDPNTTLLSWLREQGLTGTKEGCAEGECGACAVALVVPDGENGSRFQAVNSCLLLVASLADREVVSVEGIRNPDATAPRGIVSDLAGAHPVQAAMVDHGGSQCGYCTPGFVVSLFAEYYRKDRPVTGFDSESIGGNLCRCTGYRPIVDAGRSLKVVQTGDTFAARLSSPPTPISQLAYSYSRRNTVSAAGSASAAGAASAAGSVSGAAPGASVERHAFRPTSLAEALRYLADHADATLVAGGTDVVVELNQRHKRLSRVLLLDGLAELVGITDHSDSRPGGGNNNYLAIGAGTNLGELEERLAGRVPLLSQLFPLFSSRLIRARATLGGNLGTASPISDSPPALLALSASVKLVSAAGERVVPLDRFFCGYRQTERQPAEIIAAVHIPLPQPEVARFYKVSKREFDDISTVAAAFSLHLEGRRIQSARLCYGGVAATPARAEAAEQALSGLEWNRAALERALPLASTAFTPMTDQRGSSAYRARMVSQLLEKFWYDTAPDSPRAQGQSHTAGAH